MTADANLHTRLHRAFVMENLGHNPGCSSAQCPLREPDPTPTLRHRVRATIQAIADQLGLTEGTDRG